MEFYDTHTHLYAQEFDDDREKVMESAEKLGVRRFYLPNIDSSSINPMLELEKRYPGRCFPMMGLHPCSVKENYLQELTLVEDWLEKRKFCAIGEVGIDLYWDKTFLIQQQEAFRRQINWALQYKLPIVIHCREAFDPIMEIISGYPGCLRGIFHCFSGSLDQAWQVLELGNFKLGIGGVLTFKNAGLDKVVEQIELKNLVLETDAPYLAPVPHRGKRNEPGYLFNVARQLAVIKNIPIEEVAQITTQNALEVFGEMENN